MRARYFAAHLHRRPAVEHVREAGLIRVGGELVDAPDEAGAVEAERALARPAPHVGIADVGERGRDDAPLPGSELRQLELRGRSLRLLDLPARGEVGGRGRGARAPVLRPPPVVPAAEAEDLRERIGSFRACRRLLGLELELVLSCGVVEAQSEEPGDDLDAETARRRHARAPRGPVEEVGRVPQAECVDQERSSSSRETAAPGSDGAGARVPASLVSASASVPSVSCALPAKVAGEAARSPCLVTSLICGCAQE